MVLRQARLLKQHRLNYVSWIVPKYAKLASIKRSMKFLAKKNLINSSATAAERL